VTTCALPAELPGVNVITKMTVDTNHRWFGLVVMTFFMTVPAGKIDMRPIEGEVCAGIVIEIPQQPVVGVVTGAAVRSKAAMVRIILSMAIGTQSRGIRELG